MAIALVVLIMTKRMSALLALAPIALGLLAASPNAICKKGRLTSTCLLVALLDINYGDHEKASLLWVFGLVLAVIGGALVFDVIPVTSTN
ncbi:hypothetical protein GmRootA79_37110 [Acidovorax sp. A79]|uniref:hypothetical protein n=1 Tax=Acidovorax sp. A79 TaxID=3056107 RepID=UPI0034E89DEE